MSIDVRVLAMVRKQPFRACLLEGRVFIKPPLCETDKESLCTIRYISLGIINELFETLVKLKHLESIDCVHCDA